MLVLFQEFQEAVESGEKENFIQNTINTFIASDEYGKMLENEAYYRGDNPYVDNAWAWRDLTLDTGQRITSRPIVMVKSNFLRRIVDQLVNRILYNPVQFDNSGFFGDEFDDTLKEIATKASIHGVCYGLLELNNVKMFTPMEYIPFVDERTGAHLAGVRFIQVKPDRPMTVFLYETDGVTEYHLEDGNFSKAAKKVPYIRSVIQSETIHYEEDTLNYSGFPIVPMYVNTEKTGELSEPIKSKIDLYDLITSSYGDDFLRTRPIYWRVEGFNGYINDLLELRKSLDSTGIINVADITGNAKIGAEKMELPHLAKKDLQEELEMAIFRDAQVTNIQAILEGRTTATAVHHSSVAEDTKANSMEKHVARFIRRLLALLGQTTGTVRFVHRRVVDELQVMKSLELAHRMGVPAEVLIKEMPFAQGRIDAWISAFIDKINSSCNQE